jgi:type I restriction enzyme S subunit
MGEVKETVYGTVAGDWNFIPANIYCEKVTDGTHDSPKSQASGKHLITSKHIRGREIDFDNAYLISEDEFNKINMRSKVDQWDVIISMIGEYCGFCYVERNEIVDYAVKNVGMFKTGTKTKAMWLYYFLNSKIGKSILEANKSGTSQPYLTLGFLRELPVLYPNSDKEAEQIVEVLSSLDDKIDLLHRQNKTLEALAETLFRQWFVEEAEESWETTSLFDVIELIGGGTPKTDIAEYWNGDIKWISAKDVTPNHKKFIVDTEKKITEQGLSNSSAKILPKYATIISARGTVGNYCILAESMALSQSNYGIKPRLKDCYFFTYLLIANAVEELQSASYGSVFDTITTSTFKEHQITVPNEKEIQDFDKKVSPYFEKMLSNELQIRLLAKLRDTLLPKLMKGEVRVSTAEAETAIASQ